MNHSERLLRLGLQFFADGGEGSPAAGTGDATATTGDNAATTEPAAQTANTGLSSEEIQKMIQSAVDKQSASLGKTISDLKKENAELKKQNMTAEQIQQADKEEFERQKAEVELGKRQIYAHRVAAAAGYGDNADAVVDIILGDTDEKTDERLKNFKAIIDKLVGETVKKTFKENGRVPNGGNAGGEDKEKDTKSAFAAELGKKKAEQQKQSNDILKHYYGGN